MPHLVKTVDIDGPMQNLEDVQNISAYILNQIQSNVSFKLILFFILIYLYYILVLQKL